MAHSKEQYKSPDTVPEEAQTLNLLDKDFKPSSLNMLPEPGETRMWPETHRDTWPGSAALVAYHSYALRWAPSWAGS